MIREEAGFLSPALALLRGFGVLSIISSSRAGTEVPFPLPALARRQRVGLQSAILHGGTPPTCTLSHPSNPGCDHGRLPSTSTGECLGCLTHNQGDRWRSCGVPTLRITDQSSKIGGTTVQGITPHFPSPSHPPRSPSVTNRTYGTPDRSPHASTIITKLECDSDRLEQQQSPKSKRRRVLDR